MRPPSISRLRNLPLRFCAGLGLIALGACTESDQGEMGPQAFLGVPAPVNYVGSVMRGCSSDVFGSTIAAAASIPAMMTSATIDPVANGAS